MKRDTLRELLSCHEVSLFPGGDESTRTPEFFGIGLAESHSRLLSMSNGLMAYGGCFRIFGYNTRQCIDACEWNDAEYWKFSWSLPLERYWCFGETAWGDQYAYQFNSEGPGILPEVYLLDANTMQAQRIADSFDEFLAAEFLRNTEAPYDELTIAARRQFGFVPWNK